MKRTILVFICTILTFSVFNTFASTPEEELLSRKEQKLKNYLSEVKAGDRTSKERVLDEILNGFDSEKYSEDDKKLVELVDFLMGEGSIRKEFENGRLKNDYPEIRRKSVKVMAKIGGSGARLAPRTMCWSPSLALRISPIRPTRSTLAKLKENPYEFVGS